MNDMDSGRSRCLPQAAGLFIGSARSAPPPPASVLMLAPLPELSARELDDGPSPVVVVGGPPCLHWQEAIRTRSDLLYVVAAPTDGPPCRQGGDTLLPAASPAALRRHFAHLLVLKRRYTGDLPAVGARAFRWKGIRVPLTIVESEILRTLYAHEGEVVDRTSLAHLAGCSAGGDSRALDARIHRLREKLRRTPGVELVTERQRGWKLLLS